MQGLFHPLNELRTFAIDPIQRYRVSPQCLCLLRIEAFLDPLGLQAHQSLHVLGQLAESLDALSLLIQAHAGKLSRLVRIVKPDLAGCKAAKLQDTGGLQALLQFPILL